MLPTAQRVTSAQSSLTYWPPEEQRFPLTVIVITFGPVGILVNTAVGSVAVARGVEEFEAFNKLPFVLEVWPQF